MIQREWVKFREYRPDIACEIEEFSAEVCKKLQKTKAHKKLVSTIKEKKCQKSYKKMQFDTEYLSEMVENTKILWTF